MSLGRFRHQRNPRRQRDLRRLAKFDGPARPAVDQARADRTSEGDRDQSETGLRKNVCKERAAFEMGGVSRIARAVRHSPRFLNAPCFNPVELDGLSWAALGRFWASWWTRTPLGQRADGASRSQGAGSQDVL